MPAIAIRPANETDIPFIREQYIRVEHTGAPHWREGAASPYTDAWIEEVIGKRPDDQAILVAVDEAGTRLGYTWVLTLTDFDAIEPRGHIAGVGVDAAAQGRGVGRALVAAAETWCRDQRLSEVTLHCYIGNERAHQLYEHLGFENEWYHMRKAL